MDALASGADEGRGGLRYSSGSRLAGCDPRVSEWGDPARVMSCHLHLNCIGCGGLRGEVKHLSTRRRRYSVSSGERKRMMVKPCACDTRQGLRVRGCGAVLSSSAGEGARVLAGS